VNLSCADYTFPVLDRERALQLIRLLGFDAVDIGLFERSTHYSPRSLLGDPTASGRAVRAELERMGLRASDVFLQPGMEPAVAAVNDPDPGVRARARDLFLSTLVFAQQLHCTHLTGLPGVLQAALRPDEAWKLAVDETAWRVARANDAGVTYAIEPHVGSICPDPESAAQFVRSVPDLTLTLDYGHFICAGVPNEAVHPLSAHASHVHARAGARNRLQTTLAENEIDFRGLVDLLVARQYAGYVCVEYVWVDWEGCNRTDNVSETLLLRDRLLDLGRYGIANIA
jgi:sugar phosphate isomerase/epimerase